jgi:hypothetical protein
MGQALHGSATTTEAVRRAIQSSSESPPESEPKFEPKGGPLRHEERPGPKAEKHHRDRNALLPSHLSATFLLGMAQTSTGVTRPMMVAMVSCPAAASGTTVSYQ